MSKKDYQQGLSDAMQGYADFSKKQEAATRHVEAQVENVAGKVDQLSGEFEKITDYIIDKEKAAIYKLNTPVDIADLEDMEKRVLVAVLYQLVADEDVVTEEQQNYIHALQQYLKVYNPQTEINLRVIEKIEDVSAQKAILQTVLEFFYLGAHPDFYTNEQEDFLDCFQVNRRTFREIDGYVNAIIETVGVKGLSEKYGFVAAQPKSSFAKYKDNGRIPEKVADACIAILNGEKKADNTFPVRGFWNDHEFLETQDYLVFCRRRWPFKEIDDTQEGFFRIDKQTGKVEHLDIAYGKDFYFGHPSDLSFFIWKNTIYFIENRTSLSDKYNYRLIAIDFAAKTYQILPFKHPGDTLTHFHLSGNESFLMVHIGLMDGHDVKSTKTYVMDLTQDYRTFVLEPTLDEVYDAFIWNEDIMLLGGNRKQEWIPSLFRYDFDEKMPKNLFSFNDTFIYRLFANSIDYAYGDWLKNCVIEQIRCVNGKYYFLVNQKENRSIERSYHYSGFDPIEKKDMIKCGASRLFSKEKWYNMKIIPMTDHVLCLDSQYGLSRFDYATGKTEVIEKGSTERYVLLGDYLYKHNRNEWYKTNISSGVKDLQWELMFFPE